MTWKSNLRWVFICFTFWVNICFLHSMIYIYHIVPTSSNVAAWENLLFCVALSIGYELRKWKHFHFHIVIIVSSWDLLDNCYWLFYIKINSKENISTYFYLYHLRILFLSTLDKHCQTFTSTSMHYLESLLTFLTGIIKWQLDSVMREWDLIKGRLKCHYCSLNVKWYTYSSNGTRTQLTMTSM